MPRQPRLHVPGGYYHVYARGNGKQDIFKDDDDRLRWEQLLRDGLQRHNHRIHAYCWMTNHVHIAIQTGERPLAEFMKSLLSRYAKEFNRKTARSGHLFERRFDSILIEETRYLLELVRYIHQNPLRAGMVREIGDYRWSSHNAYVGKARKPWLITDVVFSSFSPNLGSAMRQYVEFVGEKQQSSVIEAFRSGSDIDYRLLGNDQWLYKVLGEANLRTELESLDQLINIVCQRNGVTEAQLASRCRSRANAKIRAEIALTAVDLGVANMTEIARRFGRSQPVISCAVNRLRDKLA